jgi:zinc/manganese transport system substrate-binding protein
VPHGSITGASGDIHVYGNPHYFYDPENGKWIAYNIAQGLARVSPSNKATFNRRYQDYCKSIDEHITHWAKVLAPYRGRQVVTYHQSAIYFLQRFGLKQFGTLEPKPGIPPSAAHVQNLIHNMKASHVKTLVIESVYSHQFADTVVRETGAKLAVVPYSVGSMGAESYLALINTWVEKYKEVLQ